jgi:glycosyltransferase involved in cell wall biosynthesis
MRLVSVVLPCRNEQANVPRVVDAVKTLLGQAGVDYELVLVDDGSRDGTWEALKAAARLDEKVRGLRLSRGFGKEAAIAAGLDVARGDAVLVMDADLQHPPSLIPDMIRRWSRGDVDVVEAVKSAGGRESMGHRLVSRLFYAVMNRLSGLDLAGSSDFKLLDARVVESWRRLGERNLFFRGLVSWMGFRRDRIAFQVAERASGSSVWGFASLARLALSGIAAFSSIPLQLVTAFGVGFLLLAVWLGVRAVIVKLSGLAIDGTTIIILLNLVTGSLVMISLGIIGQYLAQIYLEVKGRPRYLVCESTDTELGARPQG